MIFMETRLHGSHFFPLHEVTTSLVTEGTFFRWLWVSNRVCSATPGGEVWRCRGCLEGGDMGCVTCETSVTGAWDIRRRSQAAIERLRGKQLRLPHG